MNVQMPGSGPGEPPLVPDVTSSQIDDIGASEFTWRH